MVEVDQALRNRLISEMPPESSTKPRLAEQLELVDKTNTQRVRALLRACGWPKKSVHGEKAVNDTWLLVQHADHDPKFQNQAIKLLAAAVQQGEASGTQLAYLSDRVATSQKRPQLYGTQFKLTGDCGLEVMPLDDLAKVEERRKALNMPGLSEYRQQILEHALPAKCARDAK